ncbi:MAG: hypothetical protein GDA44_11485 [Prochloron sp. SP5CPC1]|nr:hypothetical protein [Candidatus Paraprochloron terpiosi SP5CPC1]
MKLFPPIASLSLTLSLLTVSCAPSTVYQCEQIMALANKMSEEGKKNSKTKDEKKVLGVADTFDAVALEMEQLEIKDEQLQEYRSGFVQFYRDHAQATRTFVTAFREKDAETAKSMIAELQEIGSREGELVMGINSYCMGFTQRHRGAER